MLKRIPSMILVLVLLASMASGVSVSALFVEPSLAQSSVDDVLADFYFQTLLAKESTDISLNSTTGLSPVDKIRMDTVKTLQEAGYEAYDVTKNTFDTVEDTLDTDLSAIGLNKENTYIIVVGGGGTASPDAVVTPPVEGGGSTFTYVSNGVTYTMRYLTVTSADDPQYAKADYVDVLKSKTQEDIERCLDAVIAYALDSNPTKVPFGTIASICGLSVSNFYEAPKSTLLMNCGTNWTRVFTQVWDTYLGGWTYGSSVEYVTTLTYMSGIKYNPQSNSYDPVPTTSKKETTYSNKYYDYTWRKEQAIYGATYYWTQYDITGNVKYWYNNEVRVTHRENF